MCGLAGIFSYLPGAPPVDEASIIQMREAMASRGPDGKGLWCAPDARVGLAHRRLSIIDLTPDAAQPMASSDGQHIVVYNGEIYNYKALRQELKATGHEFHSRSDTEVLLNLYKEKGVEMLRHLDGMYAFAIWDICRKVLFLARDPMGIKPLYYADDGGRLYFASQVHALLHHPGIDTSADPAGHVGFFLWGAVPEPHTCYRGIRALPAGAYLQVSAAGAPLVRNHFNLSSGLTDTRHRGGRTDSDCESGFKNLMEKSVASHLVGDVPVGLFLSAGVDSTVLAGLAAKAANKQIQTHTLAFKEYRNTIQDESVAAERTAAHIGSRHHTHWISRNRFNEELGAFLDAMDQPTTDGLNTYLISKMAADTGLKTAISGIGGDELFGGYPSFHQIPRIVKLVAPVNRLLPMGACFRRITAPVFRRLTSPKYAGLMAYGGSLEGAYLLRRGLFMPWELSMFLDPDFVSAGLRRLRPMAALAETITGIPEERMAISALEMSHYMRNQLLRDADWAGMAHSLEIRVPLASASLIRKSFPFIIRNRKRGKHLLGSLLPPALSKPVLARPKTGFAVPIQDWLPENTMDRKWMRRGLRGWALAVHRAKWGKAL